MAEQIKISLPDIYEPITEEMIADAKEWTLQRNENANYLSLLVAALLREAIQQLTEIAYKYNCKPEQFQFSQDEKLREEVANTMDELEDSIMEVVENYSLNESTDKKRHTTLLPWLFALSSKGTTDLRSTLHARLTQFLFDTEAQIAAMKLADYSQTKAVTRCLSTMHSVYTAPEVLAAFKRASAAMYIRTNGVHEGNRGLSSSGANNVESFAYQTAALAWARSHYLQNQEDGAAGFYVLRGSNFLCDICDSYVGFHKMEEKDAVPPYHSHCCCFVVYVNEKQ